MKQPFLWVILAFSFLSSCGKKENVRLAQNYYRLAMLELTDTNYSVHTYKKALQLIDQALEYEQKPQYQAFKATLLFKLGHMVESECFFKKALSHCTDPHVKAEIVNNYACLLAQAKRTNEALALWNELETNKSYLTPEVACVNQGKLALEGKNYEKAHTHFLKALSLAPEYLDAHYYAALTAYQLHDRSFAYNEVKTILFLEPKHEGAQKLGQVLGGISLSDQV